MRLRPSERSRWENCSGYPAFRDLLASEGALPEEAPSPYAWRGTVAHAVLAELFERYAKSKWPALTAAWAEDPSESLAWLLNQRGRSYTEEDTGQVCVVDDDMIEDVAFCALAVAKYVREMPDCRMHVELHVGGDDPSEGTADIVLESKHEVRIVDAKFGQGVDVAIENNLQLRTYAVLFVQNRETRKPQRVHLAILQPRRGGVKPSKHDISEFYAWEVALADAQARCQSDRRRLAAGSWCRWCPCAQSCPAIATVFEEAAAYASVPDAVVKPSGALLGERLRVYEDVLKPYADALAGALLSGLEHGQYDDSSGWKRVEKRAQRKWADELETEQWLRIHGLSSDEMHTVKLKSPAQIEKLLKGSQTALMLAETGSLIVKQSSGYTLARVADKRPKEQPVVALGPFPGAMS